MTVAFTTAGQADALERDRALHLLRAWQPFADAGARIHEDERAASLKQDDNTISLYACGRLTDLARATYHPHKQVVSTAVGHYWEWLSDPYEVAEITPERVRQSFPVYLPKMMIRGFLKRGWAKHGKVPLHLTAAAAVAHRLTQTERDIKNYRESIRRLTEEQEEYASARTR